jgi:thiamine kinase-like enzyme
MTQTVDTHNHDPIVVARNQHQQQLREATALEKSLEEQRTTTTTTTTASCEVIPLEVHSHDDIRHIVTQFCPQLLLVHHHKRHNSLSSTDSSSSSSSSLSSSLSFLEENPPDKESSSVSSSVLTVRPLTGGLSNELFLVESVNANTSAAANAAAVLVRIHPTTKHSLVDRNAESKIVEYLSRHALSPQVYGRFQNGRVEEYYPNVIPLQYDQMKQYATEIGTILGQLHKIHIPQDIFTTIMDPSTPQIWNRMEHWLQLAAADVSSAAASTTTTTTTTTAHLLSTLQHEYQWLKHAYHQHFTSVATSCPSRAFWHQVVLCHMDCQSLNLLLLEHPSQSQTTTNKDLKLIDFEYASPNPRGIDIANTFLEFNNMNGLQVSSDWDAYPDSTTQNEFLHAYLSATATTTTSTTTNWDLDASRDEIGKLTLFSHLSWAIWSLVPNPSIDFDYTAYAQLRLEGYRYFQKKFWS